MHQCTDEEYERFQEPEDEDTARLFENIKASGGFICVDWKDVQLTFSKTWESDQSTVEVMLLACNT